MPPKAKQPAPATKPVPKGKKPPPAMVNRQAMGTYQGKPISRSSGLYAKVKKEPEQEEAKKPTPKSKQPTPPPPKPIELNKIAPGLKALRVKIAGLIPDPNNARLHPERNLEAIKDSLRLYGQVKPIVVRKQTKVVVAGNGTMEAAKALGWTEIAANFVEMTDLEAAGFGLADNRSAELAKWDFEVVSRLQKLMGESEHAAVGWSSDELEVLRRVDWVAPEAPKNLPTLEEINQEDIEVAPGDAELLMKLKVTIEEPETQPSLGEVYKLGEHILAVMDVIEDWPDWKNFLQEGDLFCPYPGVLTFHTLKSAERRIVAVQPSTYIAGHIIDQYKAVNGESEVSLG